MTLFTVEEARTELEQLMPLLDEFVVVRSEAAEIGSALREGVAPTELGGLPEFKAAQARLDELIGKVQETGADLKGVAPLLIDFPARLDDEDVLLCWLEGDERLGWYHRTDLGFAGRRPLP